MTMIHDYAAGADAVRSSLCSPALDGELDNRRHRLNDLVTRLQAILDGGQASIDRRYGEGPGGKDSSCAPSRPGSVGMLDDALDRLEHHVDRASAVVSTLGAL